MFMVGDKQMVPRCNLQRTSEMRPYRTSTKQERDEFLRYVLETDLIEKRWESIRSTEKNRHAGRRWRGKRM